MSTNLDPARPAGPDETINLRDTYVAHGRGVPFENGWSWISSAFSIFKRAAGVWIGMIIVLCLIYIVLGVIPVVGAIAMLVGIARAPAALVAADVARPALSAAAAAATAPTAPPTPG